MAHEWFMSMVAVGEPAKIKDAWAYADAMQAEADKCLIKDEYKGLNSITKLNAEEWQPDWSQAPKNLIYFAVDENGSGWFFNGRPRINDDDCWVCGDYSVELKYHGYKGDWRNSLRKRPEKDIESMDVDELKKLSKSIENIQECEHEWDHVSAYGGTGDYYVCTCGAEKHSF